MIFPLLQLYCTFTALVRKCPEISGAGEGNRTLVSGLGSPHSTIEPHPRNAGIVYNSLFLGVQQGSFLDQDVFSTIFPERVPALPRVFSSCNRWAKAVWARGRTRSILALSFRWIIHWFICSAAARC